MEHTILFYIIYYFSAGRWLIATDTSGEFGTNVLLCEYTFLC